MPDRLTQVAEVLAEHQEQANNYGTIQCQCGRFETTYPSRMAAHQAEMLRAAGLVATETEWGVDLPMGRGIAVWSEESCRAFVSMQDESRLMRRGVTAWVSADEGSDRG